jgi:signal transduction histidine kinase
MRDRAEALGGSLDLESDETGTTIIVMVPLADEGEAGEPRDGVDP